MCDPKPLAAISGGVDAGVLRQKLIRVIMLKKFMRFYSDAALDALVRRVASLNWVGIAAALQLPLDQATDFVALALYNFAIFVDDSGSMMEPAHHGDAHTRKDDARTMITRIVQVIRMFDTDGILLRFINYNLPDGAGDTVKSEADVLALFEKPEWRKATPM